MESATAVEKTDTGWKFLTLLPLDQIQADGDAMMDVPATDELQLIPLILSLNDADGGTRETQVVWSIKPNVSSQWWNTPAQWETVAVAGLNATDTAIEDGPLPSPNAFSLSQSVPNPVADRAEIAFSLGAPGRATIEVFNMLGQRVTMITDRELPQGKHTVTFDTSQLPAGLYVYRLRSGEYVEAKRMAVIR